MTLNEMREELLGQHAAIRQLVAGVQEAAEQCRRGLGSARAELSAQLGRLHEAVEQHNAREEELLRGVIRHVDAWGDVREALLGEHHAAEHGRLVEAIEQANATGDDQVAARQVLEVVARLVDHMRDEEDKILHPKILTDEIAGIDNGFGG